MADNSFNKSRKRKKVKYIKPNELFLKWLEEWYLEAVSKGSKIQFAFGKALCSLKKYPLPLKTGKECMILEHFGPGICVKLDRRLAEYKKEHPDEFPNEPEPSVDDDDVVAVGESPIKTVPNKNKSPKKSNYIPAKNSVAFAIIVAMHENGVDCSIHEDQLKIVLKRLVDKPYNSSHIHTLIKRGLITENRNSDVFTLTQSGKNAAEIVYAKYLLNKKNKKDHSSPKKHEITSYNSRLTDFDLIPLGSTKFVKDEADIIDLESDSQSSVKGEKIMKYDSDLMDIDKKYGSQGSNSQFSSVTSKTDSQSSTSSYSNSQDTSDETICMVPGTFEIILAVDNHETGARYTQATETIEELTRHNVRHEVKSLKVGDFTWIAKDIYNNELVLPYIVERKRMDDFAHSIKDQRFLEQKFRLKKSGLKNLIYLVENYKSNMFLGLPLTSVLQAATNTEVIDEFTVKFTENHADSMKYLRHMTMFLTGMYADKTLMSSIEKNEISSDDSQDVMTLLKYKHFNKMSSKIRNYKVGEMWLKQLMQLHGLSLAKATVIVEKYPTPSSLINAFHQHGTNLLADLKYTQMGTRIGNVISSTLYQFYTRQTFT